MLLCVGAAVLVLRWSIPDSVARGAEFAVGIMLLVLGGSLGMRVLRERWHIHSHDHDGKRHTHLHTHAIVPTHGHSHWWRESVKPLFIGMAHGLAGSAALVLVVASSSHTLLQGLGYIAVFGVGSIIGMMLIGLGLSVPMVWSLSAGQPVVLAVQALASLGSIGMGLSMLIRIALGEHPR